MSEEQWYSLDRGRKGMIIDGILYTWEHLAHNTRYTTPYVPTEEAMNCKWLGDVEAEGVGEEVTAFIYRGRRYCPETEEPERLAPGDPVMIECTLSSEGETIGIRVRGEWYYRAPNIEIKELSGYSQSAYERGK